MGFDDEFFSYIRDGRHEGMSITVLRPHRSLQLKPLKPIHNVTTLIHETSQTVRAGMNVDRVAATRDRERVGRRYSRDLDVRYMSSWRNLKEKLLSAYSCNQKQCPIIKERLIQHHQSVHGGRRCEKKCTLATSKSKNCVSIRAGPDFDQYSDQKCSDCPMPHTSSNYIKRNSNSSVCCTKPIKGNLKINKKYAGGCTSPCNIAVKNEQTKNECESDKCEIAKSRFDQYVDTSCNKSSITKFKSNPNEYCNLEKNKCSRNVNDDDAKDHFERCSGVTARNNNMLSKNRNNIANSCCNLGKRDNNLNTNHYIYSRRHVNGYKNTYSKNLNNGCDSNNNFERSAAANICDDNMINNNRNNNANGCIHLEMPDYSQNTNHYIHSGRYVDGCTTPTNTYNSCYEKPGFTDSCTGATSYRNACSSYNDTFAQARYREGCTMMSNANLTNNTNYANGYCDRFKMPVCDDNFTTTYSSSFVGNIEAPKFPIVRSNKYHEEDDCQPSTSKSCNDSPFNSKNNKPTNTPIMVDGGNTCKTQSDKVDRCKDLYTVDECTGDDSIMSSLMSIVKNRRNNKNKTPKTSKHSSPRRIIDKNTSAYKSIPPYAVDERSNGKSESKQSLKNNEVKNRRNSNTTSIYKEVKEWIREVPMYPNLEKEAKEKNTMVINELAKTLSKLSGIARSLGYEEKVRNVIETYLDKIPIWYPGPKREQSGFKHSLVDRLSQRLKNLKRKNAGTNPKKHGKNAVTQVQTSLIAYNQSFSEQFTNNPKDVEVKMCVIDWLRLIYSETNNNNVIKNQIFLLADLITFRINSLLNKQISTKNLKIILKTAVLNIMDDLPIVINCLINKDIHIQDLAEDLAKTLLCIQAKYGCKYSNFSIASNFSNKYCFPIKRQSVICSEIRKCFEDASVVCTNMVIEEAGKIIDTCYVLANHKGKRHARNEIMNLLITSTNLSESQAWNLAKMINKKVPKIFNEGEECTASSQTCSQHRKPFTTSVYTSIEEFNHLTYPVTSTPKKKRAYKEVPKLSPQEIKYMENVKYLIKSWMDILPKHFRAPDEQEFKETMINDLAGDITDDAKLGQLVPDSKKNHRQILQYIVYRWIYRLGVFDDYDIDDEIEVFLDTLQELPVPILTQPYHGNRQAIENIKFNTGKKGDNANWRNNFIPKETDVLQDEISIWMHEQPSDIFTNNDQTFRQNKIHELAKILLNKEGEKRSQNEFSKDISKWLNPIVRPEKKRDINELTEKLKARIIYLPQDATLTDIQENREMEREEYRKSKLENANSQKTYSSNSKNKESANLENSMAIFLSKFIEHHYDIDDPLARRAFNRLLNSHLLSLNTPTRKDIYDKFEKNTYDGKFPPETVIKELEYIKDISDWLKNIPIDPLYNTLGNSERIDFVNGLALSIREIEEEREKNPEAIDYDLYLCHEIAQHLTLLPLPREHLGQRGFIAVQLFTKIVMHRQDVVKAVIANESIDTTGINCDNIGDFIEEFIKHNGEDIAHDELKMEAWAIRLIREIKSMIENTPHLCKADIYDKLTNVPKPNDETANFFVLELDYVKEITNWMKNLPFLQIDDSEKAKITNNICRLAEQVVETDRKRLANPNDKELDTNFDEYVAKWISELPLDKRQVIVLPVIIQQLKNRLEKTKQKVTESTNKDNTTANKNKTTEASANKNVKANKSKTNNSLTKFSKKNKGLSMSNMTDAIEKWVEQVLNLSALPKNDDNDDNTTNIKNDVCGKLFQEVAQLNMNPTVNNDDILYKDKLEDEINNILENIPQNDEFQNKKDKLKDDIIHTIIEIKNDIKDKTAGNTYKLELEKRIDSSIPNPAPCYQVYDPGFEIYKDRLATAFVLENFDHGADIVKIKYETLLKKDIDKYFNHARNRNAIPLSRDKLYNELYSALFQVPIPNEVSVIDEVEKAKTRCEIDMWFEELPMREANGLSELLDWDKILSTLATRIHEIEKSESKPDDKIFKEIMKWIVKLPYKPGNETSHEQFAKRLQKRLKSTTGQRKCVLNISKARSKKKKAKAKVKVSTKKSKEDSQIAGPSSGGKLWTTVHDTTNSRNPRRKPGDELYDVLHNWCNQLPINVNDQDNVQMVRDDLTVKMIMKISDLNANAEIFNDDILYDKLLGEELEGILSILPTTCSFNDNKATKICELKERIKSIKPHIMEERASHKYKQGLVNAVVKIVDKPQTDCLGKEAYLDGVRNDIIDDFILYKYSNDDEEDKQQHKINIQDNISKYASATSQSNTKIDKNDPKNNSLLKANQLISELAKISPNNSHILRDKVEEIRMKKELANFFDEVGVPTNEKIAKLTYLKESLAKKLYEIETSGYNGENENKMKQEIMRCLKKLGKDKNSAVIEAFIGKLKNNENARRIPEDYAKEISKHDCSHICPSNTAINQNVRNLANFPNKLITSPTPRLVKNKSREPQPCLPSCRQVNNVSGRYIANENVDMTLKAAGRESEVFGEEDDDDEDEVICYCEKKYRHRKRMPYCMMPMPMPMGYLRPDILSSLWSGMPLH